MSNWSYQFDNVVATVELLCCSAEVIGQIAPWSVMERHVDSQSKLSKLSKLWNEC